MIDGFRCRETERIWNEQRSRRLPQRIQQKALDKLQLLDAAATLDDLRVPPGNRLEALKGDRVGQHSIRINDQYRICFNWREGRAERVEIVDYH
ncbi:MAG: type II toxin-antitoxin system RelE/ParE family toxin [Verrucomicrobia bacterium]|nr:type II toxin-antitoxin system RelE/ParE family toxin [Verrucomicrobiota bacterium]